MSDAEEDIDSTYERLDEAYTSPEADEVAGPVSEPLEYVTSKQLKEEARKNAGEEESKGWRGGESLGSTIVFSVAVVAVVGAIMAIAKKLRET